MHAPTMPLKHAMHICKLGTSLSSKQLYSTRVLTKSHGYKLYIMNNNRSHQGVFGMWLGNVLVITTMPPILVGHHQQ
jgi:hypothetical protein